MQSVANEPPPSTTEPPETIVEMGRLNGLSDGVFAFALTLLVLDIRIPEGVLAGELPARLLELGPRLLVYLISFVVIGGAWGSHQRMLAQIRRGDGPLVWLNLFSLLFVTLMPAASALLGRYPTAFPALLCFAADVLLIQGSAAWLWRHSSRHGLVNPALDPRVVQSVGRRLSLGAVVFAASVPLALLKISLAYGIWIGMFLLLFATDWLSWQRAAQTRHLEIPLEGASRGHILLKHAGGRLRVTGESLEDGLLRGVFGGGLDSRLTRTDELVEARLTAQGRQGFMSLRFPWAWGAASALDWSVAIADAVPVDLEIETAGGQTTLDLGSTRVTRLRIAVSAVTLEVSLPSRAGRTEARIEASAASIVIRVPPGVSARIRAATAVGSADIDPVRFPERVPGVEYRSVDFEQAENRVDLSLDVTLGSVEIV
jgi:uncharacterized membrane protein